MKYRVIKRKTYYDVQFKHWLYGWSSLSPGYQPFCTSLESAKRKIASHRGECGNVVYEVEK